MFSCLVLGVLLGLVLLVVLFFFYCCLFGVGFFWKDGLCVVVLVDFCVFFFFVRVV